MTYKSRLLVLSYNMGILPKRWHRMAEVRKLNADFWLWRKLVETSSGYFKVEPMPTDRELDEYYEKAYWSTVRGKDRERLVRYRDLHHWTEITRLFGNSAPGSLFNFGAGHGGVSLLAAAAGWKVVNFDPGNSVEFLDIENVASLDSVTGEFDLVYSSHSLEHVNDPEGTMELLMSLLKPDGRIFVEVPNCHPVRGIFPDQGVEPPHTLYFRRQFFRNLPLEPIVLSTADRPKSKEPPVFREDDRGRVIRYIGQRSDTNARSGPESGPAVMRESSRTI